MSKDGKSKAVVLANAIKHDFKSKNPPQDGPT